MFVDSLCHVRKQSDEDVEPAPPGKLPTFDLKWFEGVCDRYSDRLRGDNYVSIEIWPVGALPTLEI